MYRLAVAGTSIPCSLPVTPGPSELERSVTVVRFETLPVNVPCRHAERSAPVNRGGVEAGEHQLRHCHAAYPLNGKFPPHAA